MDDFYDKDMNELKLEEARLQELENQIAYHEQFRLVGDEEGSEEF